MQHCRFSKDVVRNVPQYTAIATKDRVQKRFSTPFSTAEQRFRPVIRGPKNTHGFGTDSEDGGVFHCLPQCDRSLPSVAVQNCLAERLDEILVCECELPCRLTTLVLAIYLLPVVLAVSWYGIRVLSVGILFLHIPVCPGRNRVWPNCYPPTYSTRRGDLRRLANAASMPRTMPPPRLEPVARRHDERELPWAEPVRYFAAALILSHALQARSSLSGTSPVCV